MNGHDLRIVDRVRREMVSQFEQVGFAPTCPRCDRICPAASVYCAECGCRLYPAWSGRYERT